MVVFDRPGENGFRLPAQHLTARWDHASHQQQLDMLLGVLADVHGNAPALEAVLTDLRRTGVQQALVAGDMIGYYPFVNETLSLLRAFGCTVVLGNHEGYLLGRLPCTPERWRACGLDLVERTLSSGHREWLTEQPFLRDLRVDGRLVQLCHGSPRNPEEYVYPNRSDWSGLNPIGADIVVMGHTHLPLVRYLEGSMLLNPGSCGQPRDYDSRAAFAVLDPVSMHVEIRRAAYDVASVQRAVAEEGLWPELGTILTRRRGEH